MRFLILLLALVSLKVEAATIQVANNAGLRSALSRAKGGDTLALAPGNYSLSVNGTTKADSFVKYASEVKITSAQPSRPAVFTSLRILAGRNMSFNGITFQSSSTDGGFHLAEVKISEHIHFNNSKFIGKTKDGYGAAVGLYQSGLTTDLQVVGCDFTGFYIGSALFNVNGLTVRDSQYSNISYDVVIMNFVYNALIQNNRMEKRARPGGDKHQDLIQIANDGSNDASRDITIRGNQLFANDAITHGIYIGNENAKNSRKTSDYYRNILIENNTVNNAQALGITVGQTIGLNIRNNNVQQMIGVNNNNVVAHPVIRVSSKSTSVSITGNTTTMQPFAANAELKGNWRVLPTPGSWTITGNTVVPKR